MFKVALVQNISEMRNYSYADLRKDLRGLSVETQHFTRENIEALPSVLNVQYTDCVLFASNVFNDKSIYSFVTQESFVKAFQEYLNQGGACLIMHQNSLKEQENPFPFLGDSVLKLENNYAKEFVTLHKPGGAADAYFNFPNKVTVEDILSNCTANTAVSGKYWLLMRPSGNQWSPVLLDNLGNAVIAKHNTQKVIFSSLLLDYQKHIGLLHNVLVNLLSNNRSLAILQNEATETLGFSYFLNSLENKKLYYKKYANDEQSLEDLVMNASLGVHSAILINHNLLSSLPEKVKETVDKYGVKLIELSDREMEKSDSFTVHSVDKSLALLFSKLELRVQEDLASGFVSGSFMKTVEVLAKLKEFESVGMTRGVYDKESIAHVLEKMSSHMEQDGSYDKTFGATCKAFWVFATFLGKAEATTKAAYAYIKKNKNVSTVREQLERYAALSMMESDPQKYLRETCSDIINNVIYSRFEYITEYDFIKLMQVAIAIGDENMLMGMFHYIEDNVSESGELFNSYVTSIVSSYLIDMYGLLSNERAKERIRALLFDLMLYLRKINVSQMPLEESLQTVCTLYKFETVVSFPIDDLTEIIFKTGNFPHEYHAFENQINVYQKTRMEIDAIENENKELRKKNKEMKKFKIACFVMLTVIAVLVYFSVYMAILLNDSDVSVWQKLSVKIRDSWPSLFTLAVVPLITFIFDKFIKNKKDK